MLGAVRFLVPIDILKSMNMILRNGGKGAITINQRLTFSVLVLNSRTRCIYQGCYESKAVPRDTFETDGRVYAPFNVELPDNFQFPVCNEHTDGGVFFIIDLDSQKVVFSKTGISAEVETEMSFC